MGVDMNANLVGQNLGPYRIVEQIGLGGMATVYKAYEPALDRYVAIKVLPPYFAHDPDFTARFDREAKAVARLNHPNILPIYSFGQEGGLSYIAMRYVGEGTLKDRLGQPLDLETALDILRQIGLALDYAHCQGIIHRDVKPANVLMAEGHSQAPGGGNWVLLADFGLARMVESSSQLTKSGVGVGTPAYMSPEQGQGIRVDACSDLYSLGVVLYEMLTGRVPYEAETPMAVVLKHIMDPLPLPRSLNPALPDAAERVILKAMAKSPEDRFQTAQEMVEALERAQEESAAQPALPLETVTFPETLPVEERPAEALPVQAPDVDVPPAETPVVGTSIAEGLPVKEQPVAEQPARVPFVKRMPLWAWGAIGLFVVLVAVGGALIATGGWPRATPTATPASISRATSTSRPPTSTPESAPPTGPERWVSIEPCEGVVPWQICIRDEESDEVIQVTHDLDFGEAGATAWSPDGEQIVFNAGVGPNADGGYDHDLYLINADGSDLRQITEGGTTDLDPSWSPDGEWIAFHRDCGLWIVHPDGSGARALLGASDALCAGGTSWSRDSQHIAFVNWHDENDIHEIWVIGSDGRDPHVVYTLERVVDWIVPAWSPDDDLLACIYAVKGKDEGFVIDPAGGEPERLEEDELPWHWLPNLGLWGEGWPAIESAPPAGPERWVSIEPCEGVVPWQICVRDEESDEVMQVTHNLDFGEQGVFSWSPDGEQIVFNAGSGPGANGHYDHDIYVIDADGSDLRQITEGETTDVDPSWSPDGEWIAFHRDCGLWLVHPDGSDGRELLEGSDDLCVGSTSWSHDGQRIAFVNWHDEDNVHEIWAIGSDGRDPHVVYAFERAVDWIAVAWSPDGSRLSCIYAVESGHEGFVLDPQGSEPYPIPEHELPWTWYSNHWPQWGGGDLPSTDGPVPEDPWGLIVVPPGGAIGVGLVADFSGTVSEFGPLYENAVRLAVEDRGEISGFPVRVVVADGGCAEEMGIVAAQTMIGDASIAGVVGHSCSVSCRTAVPIYEEAYRVMISPSCTETGLSTPGYAVFNRVVVQDDQGGDERNREIVATDPYRDFAARYEQRYGHPLDGERGFYAAYAYDAASILLEAIAGVAVVDDSGALIVGRQSLAEAVRGTAGYPGVTGVIYFDDRGNRLP